MRFVAAIVTFVVAAVLIGLGIAQRSIWAPPDSVVAQTTLKGDPAFVVISGAALNEHPGQQTLRVSGAPKPFVAYGRTADVKAWLGDEPYTRLSFKNGELVSKTVQPGSDSDDAKPTGTPTPTPTATGTASTDAASENESTSEKKKAGPNPIGSDLWLEQFVGEDAATTKLNVPDSVSVIIASDGTKPAPSSIGIVWPLDERTPWSGPLLVGGGILLVIGLVLYLFALRHLRRSRGPRRGGGGRPPKLPRKQRYPTSGELDAAPERPALGREMSAKPRRRAVRRGLIATPIVVTGALVFTGCSPQYWPSFDGSPTPTTTATPLATQLPGQGKDTPSPAVTVPQLANIVTRISTVAADADAKLDATLIGTRFEGPALDERTANYAIRAKKADAAAPQAIPAGPVTLGLPQATDTWPRVVSAVVQDKKNEKSAPIDLVMVQETPRDNYKVMYAVSLQANANVLDLPPANIGTSLVPPDSKLLLMPPSKIAEAYGDVLLNGDKSKYIGDFDEDSDGLAKQVGAAYKAQQIANYPKTGSLTFAEQPGDADPIALATNDSGAVVATSLNEMATVKPVEAGAKVGQGSTTEALTGVAESETGLETTYGYQLLFYVPPADSKQKIRLLGFTQAVVSAKEL